MSAAMSAAMSTAVELFKDTYLDSVVQLSATRAMSQVAGVAWASSAMATAANLETLSDKGFAIADLEGPRANDLILAVLATDANAAAAAIEAGRAILFPPLAGRGPGGGVGGDGTGGDGSLGEGRRPARSLASALARLDAAAAVAIISVPGPYAAVEAHKALTAGMHVLLFSDNVDLDQEIELKDRAQGLGLLVMGPGAGTAMLGGTGLAFANVVKPGRVAVIAAAGTGAQEAMCLLDQWGAGVSHVIGLGGRDLSAAVGGRMAHCAIAALRDDPATDAILLVSKPPDPSVARSLVNDAGTKPLIGALIGLRETLGDLPPNVQMTATLEAGVVAALGAVGRCAPDPASGLSEAVTAACSRLQPGRTLIRGLFSGGTLCYESLSLLSQLVGPVYSNTPIDKRWGLPAPLGAHTCLDLGEEEYTKGRPHPMIDPEARIELMRQVGLEDQVAVVLLDVVLGFGSHADPAGLLAPVAGAIMAGGEGPQVVAYVLGTEGDPQGLEEQRRVLRQAGCIVPATAARASLAAAALATRRPDLVLRLP